MIKKERKVEEVRNGKKNLRVDRKNFIGIEQTRKDKHKKKKFVEKILRKSENGKEPDSQ